MLTNMLHAILVMRKHFEMKQSCFCLDNLFDSFSEIISGRVWIDFGCLLMMFEFCALVGI